MPLLLSALMSNGFTKTIQDEMEDASMRFKTHSTRAVVFLLILLLASASLAQSPVKPSSNAHPRASGISLARVAPEAVGMSSERLARIRPVIQQSIDQGKIAGAVTLVLRNG